MCGICGIVKFDADDSVSPGLLDAMTDRISHRGPDDFGYFLQGPVGLGHRRLSIIDIGGGKQPIFNEDGSIVIVFNGEIYNYADLTADLLQDFVGQAFRIAAGAQGAPPCASREIPVPSNAFGI